MSKSKYNWNTVLEEMENRGYILLSDQSEYKGASTKIRYICPKHKDKGEQRIDTYHLVQGRGCYYCGREVTEAAHRTIPDEDLCRAVAEQNGFVYIGCGKQENSGRTIVKFICPSHEMLGVQTAILANMQRGMKGCKYCSGKQLPVWYIEYRMHEVYPEIEILSPISKLTDYIDVRCTVHDYKYKSTPQNIIIGHKCKYCGLEKLSEIGKISKDEYIKRLSRMSPDLELIDEYDCVSQKALFRCKKCGNKFRHTAGYVLTKYDFPCPSCDTYTQAGEAKVNAYLRSHGIVSIRQKRFSDCIDIRTLPFDFYLPDYNMIIEYDGIQHFKPVYAYHIEDPEAYLELVKRHDEIKNKYCRDNNIKLIRIPYTDYNLIETILDKVLN